MNRHYPLHAQNLWAAAPLRRRATSVFNLYAASQRGARRVLSCVARRVLSCVARWLGPDAAAAAAAAAAGDGDGRRDGDGHGGAARQWAAGDRAAPLGATPMMTSGILSSLHRWLPDVHAFADSAQTVLSSVFSDILYTTQMLPDFDSSAAAGDSPSRWCNGRGADAASPDAPAETGDADEPHFRPSVRGLLRLLLYGASWPVRFVGRTRASMLKYRLDVLKRTSLLQKLEAAESYEEWRDTALALDSLEGSAAWKLTPSGALASDPISAVCDTDILASRLKHFCQLYKAGNMLNLSSALRESLVRNTAGICHPDLHAFCRVGTKLIVEDYVNIVSFFLLRIAAGRLDAQRDPVPEADAGTCDFDDLTLDEKLKFFNETRHAYGRTALMLSGGAGMGLHHLGVVKALLDHDLLPKVVSGTSAGAVVASIVGIFDDADLRKILKSEDLLNPRTQQPFSFRFFDDSLSIMRRLRRVLRKGAFQDVRMLQDALRRNYGDVTFGEAYRLTRRILNITVCPIRNSSGPPLLLNYLTTPHVLIWSAAAASCALPMVFAPVGLVAKDATGRLVPYQPDGIQWIDGSVSSDVPLARIGELFNVNHFIVSQTNPHVIPRGLPIFHTSIMMLLKSEFQFRYWQALQLRLVPRVISQIFPHMLQPYEGDVTIMPEVSLRDLAQLFRNPTTSTIREFLRRGELQTFPKLDRVRLQCLIERTLDVCVDVVAKGTVDDMAHNRDSVPSGYSTGHPLPAPEQPSFGRVPSWLWVDSLPWGALERRNKGKGANNGEEDDSSALKPTVQSRQP